MTIEIDLEDTYDVQCPYCGALAGFLCKMSSKELDYEPVSGPAPQSRRYSHSKRWKHAKELKNSTPLLFGRNHE